SAEQHASDRHNPAARKRAALASGPFPAEFDPLTPRHHAGTGTKQESRERHYVKSQLRLKYASPGRERIVRLEAAKPHDRPSQHANPQSEIAFHYCDTKI